MAKDIVKSPNKAEEPKHSQPHLPHDGLTMEQLRYQRALVALQKEFAKQKALDALNKVRHTNPLAAKSSPLSKATGLIGTLIGRRSAFDYAMLGFSLFSSGRKIFSLIHRKK